MLSYINAEIPEEIPYAETVNSLTCINNNMKNVFKNITLLQNLKYLEIKNNKIFVFECSILPNSLEEIVFTNNNTIYVGKFNEGIKKINLSNNKIVHLPSEFPLSLTELDMSSNENIKKINIKNNTNLEKIDISKTSVSEIDDFPDNIEILTANGCNIKIIQKFPTKLKEIIIYKNKIKKILCEFPENLETFDAYMNELSEIPEFPQTIKKIDLSRNEFEIFPNIPTSVDELDIAYNFFGEEEIKKIKMFNSILERNGCEMNYLPMRNKKEEKKINLFSYEKSNKNYIIHKSTYIL